jgi:hypothetical protein
MSVFLQQELLDENFSFEKINDDILLVKNFISKEELNDIFEIINNAEEKEWLVEYMGYLKSFCMEKFGRDDVDNLVAEGKFEITKNWEDKNLNILHTEVQKIIYSRLTKMIEKADSNLEVSGLATIQRMQEGVELKSHSDQHTDPSIRYATILYLNEEYNDGEIFFPNFDIELKPNSGSLLIFPGTEEYEHGVRHVGPGPIRYVLVGFIKEKDHYKNNRY